MNHVPLGEVPSCHPLILVDRLIAFYVYEVMIDGEVAVKLCRGDRHLLVVGKTLCRTLDNGKDLGEHLIELTFHLVEDCFL